MDYQQIILSKEGAIATITLNRPERLNAYGVRMGEELAAAIEELERDDQIRAFIITGAGRAFCVGHDQKEAAEHAGQPRPEDRSVPKLSNYPPLLMRRPEKPVVAAINGLVTGGGLALALMCDVRLASEKARFCEVHVSLGTIPGAETWFLPRIVGVPKALELILTSDWIDAKEAERIGLVNRVVPHEELEKAAKELASKIAKAPPLALKMAKRAVYHGLQSGIDESLEFVAYTRKLLQEMGERRPGFVKKKPQS